MQRSCTTLTTLLILMLSLSAWGQQNLPYLDKAYVHVLQKEYHEALDITQPLLDGLALNTIEEITLAHKILGVSQCQLKNYSKALEHFQTLKTFTSDETLAGLSVDAICQQIFITQQLPTQKEKRFRLSTPIPPQTTDNVTAIDLLQSPQNMQRPAPISRYIPFGVGQFKNQNKKKGVAFLIAQTLLYSTAVITLNSFSNQDDPSRALRDTGITTLVGGIFVSTWGIVDALQTYRATTPNP